MIQIWIPIQIPECFTSFFIIVRSFPIKTWTAPSLHYETYDQRVPAPAPGLYTELLNKKVQLISSSDAQNEKSYLRFCVRHIYELDGAERRKMAALRFLLYQRYDSYELNPASRRRFGKSNKHLKSDLRLMLTKNKADPNFWANSSVLAI